MTRTAALNVGGAPDPSRSRSSRRAPSARGRTGAEGGAKHWFVGTHVAIAEIAIEERKVRVNAGADFRRHFLPPRFLRTRNSPRRPRRLADPVRTASGNPES